MTPEVARRHYLEAMGITAWACRYQLPNARPTEACEWDDTPAATTPPRERLQALLDDAPSPKPADPPPVVDDVPASPSAVRALLDDRQKAPANPAEAPATSTPDEAPATSPHAAPAKPLTFHVSCVCIGGRWLSLHAGDLSAAAQRLLANICQAAGLADGTLPEVTRFKWPPMANAFVSDDPLEEAREGVTAFISGAASRRHWQLEKILWWGADVADPDSESLSTVLDVEADRSRTLGLPVWQAPALTTLLESPAAKRALWPELCALAKDWQAASLAQDDR
ncbi:hypothetical protein [Vreelandella gomseomensis]|uniref:Energy transducer TonB n=1 Tax=Vreelandella gomseomensis TaxID=370766 RepID=A0ABU1GCX3_9GAMM|nr:hypothetical protein [Halomonas gomseomensis]MDR5875338.1 hypothetical protein [Halomonas gomseomensis]